MELSPLKESAPQGLEPDQHVGESFYMDRGDESFWRGVVVSETTKWKGKEISF